jgi:uncharacterized protein YkwD
VKIGFPLVVITILLLSTGCATRFATESLSYVQQSRQDAGIDQLQWDDDLYYFANERAKYITETLDFTHDLDYLTKNIRDHGIICEVIGRQPIVDPGRNEIVYYAIGYGWTVSSEHAKCALGKEFKKAAIAGYVGKDGWIYEVMWLTD